MQREDFISRPENPADLRERAIMILGIVVSLFVIIAVAT